MDQPVKHQPDTPLPWEPCDEAQVCSAGRVVASTPYGVGDQDAAYIAHSANAYGPLVAAVHRLITMPQNDAAERLRRKDEALTMLRHIGEWDTNKGGGDGTDTVG